MTDHRPLLTASMLVSRDGLDDLEVAISGRYEALDGAVEDVEAVWIKDIVVDAFAQTGPIFEWGWPVVLTPAEEQQAEQLLFETLPEPRAEQTRMDDL